MPADAAASDRSDDEHESGSAAEHESDADERYGHTAAKLTRGEEALLASRGIITACTHEHAGI